ncbi:unnamed protein product [Medioppia subpectinata]|uniref:Sulfotransferase domain-containing protein n=1 Tax=Medioppia subpectinata TaxID=1979941 RepID=A0A7R9PYM6_9ACAR|nr:unnamed protein product [Medioppia subpectinata]CAG2106238.1 unnamed protein product [Medioppia subpectinata]
MFALKCIWDVRETKYMRKLTNRRVANINVAADEPNLDDDPELAQYVRSIPNALRLDHILLQGYLIFPQFLNKINKFEVRRDDIWLATYPKSGTTWTEEILSLIHNGGDIDKVKDKLLPKRVKHLEVGLPVGHNRWLKAKKGRRLIATHLPATHIPNQLKQLKAKVIYVVRNPKDTAVSFYHHHRMSSFLGNYSGSWDTFSKLFVGGHLVYGDWLQHVEGFWRLHQQNPLQVLFISYEELNTDLPKMIALMANFMGRRLTDETIDRIANHCSFESMKDNKMVNRENFTLRGLFDMKESRFMRKGQIGTWRDTFTAAQSQMFDAKYEERLHSMGLSIAYDSESAATLMESTGRIVSTNVVQQIHTII